MEYEYDSFDRLSSVEYTLVDSSTNTAVTKTEEYSYYELDDLSTSYRVSEYNSTIGDDEYNYLYTYDSDGNISKIVIGDKEIRYTYDDLGQLLSEENELLNQSLTYTYDNAGNIKTKKVCVLTTGDVVNNYSYTYSDSEWGDRLISFGGGSEITYDEIGNPLSYYNGTSYTFTWEGRKLVGAIKGSTNMSFAYNDEGIRTSKTVNGVVHTYQLNGIQIVSEQWSDKLIVYLYDSAGMPIGISITTTDKKQISSFLRKGLSH